MILHQTEPTLRWTPIIPFKPPAAVAMDRRGDFTATAAAPMNQWTVAEEIARTSPLHVMDWGPDIIGNCLHLFPEIKGVIVVTDNTETHAGIEQSAYVLAVPLKESPPLALLPVHNPAPPPMTLFHQPDDLALPYLESGPPPPLYDYSNRHAKRQPRCEAYQLPPMAPIPTLPLSAFPERFYAQDEEPEYLELLGDADPGPYKILLQCRAIPMRGGSIDSLIAVLEKTQDMLQEHIDRLHKYGDRLEGVAMGADACSCPQWYHPETPEFTEEDRRELNKRQPVYTPVEPNPVRDREELKRPWEAREMTEWGRAADVRSWFGAVV
ncbi:hypothetical protein FN846DRAFT_958416, partial [Sphaerosporella brunnea]